MSVDIGPLCDEDPALLRLEAALQGQPWPPEHRSICDLSVKNELVDHIVYVQHAEELVKLDAVTPYGSLVVGDARGFRVAKAWDKSDEVLAVATPGSVVRIHGYFKVQQRWANEIVIRSVEKARPGEYVKELVVPTVGRSYAEMTWELEDLIGSVADDGIRELLRHLLWHGELALRWAVAPAAKLFHQAYKFGLMEHSLDVAWIVAMLCERFPGLDRSRAIAGALLHDIGKVVFYWMENGSIDVSLEGELKGEITLGQDIVEKAIEELDCLSPERSLAMVHSILAHHGKREHGSPVEPGTLDAGMVHLADMVSALVGNYDRMRMDLVPGESLGKHDRALGRRPYFGGEADEEPVAWGDEAYVSP